MRKYLILLILVKCLMIKANDDGGNETESDSKELLIDPLKFPSASNAMQFKRSTSYSDPFSRRNYNQLTFKGHPCNRECRQGQSLTCYYQFFLQERQQMGPECAHCVYDIAACKRAGCITGDGVENTIKVVNGQLPSPPILVCENDQIVVDVHNLLKEQNTMHWHGMEMSQTPEMDGAPYLTQYPIQPGEIFRYDFPADRSGTLWYHSHMGMQRGEGGLAGNLIIRQTREKNPHSNLYDYDLSEHHFLITDVVYSRDTTVPGNIIVNGKGRNHLEHSPASDTDSRHHYLRVKVKPNRRYRMRFISNGIFNCPLEVSIQNHKMLVIAADGNLIEPVWADSFFLTASERHDVVVWTDQPAGSYWIRVKGYNDCLDRNLYQGVVMQYSATPKRLMPNQEILENLEGPERVRVSVPYQLTAVDIDPAISYANIRQFQLRSLNRPPWSASTRFQTFYTTLAALNIDGIEYRAPAIAPLLAPYLINDNDMFCNYTTQLQQGIDCSTAACECANLRRLPAFSAIELVVGELMGTTHPFHMHGHDMYIVGQFNELPEGETIGNLTHLRQLDERGLLRRLPNHYPSVLKDTAELPDNGYLIVRFISKPGYWMYHCHIETHSLGGMSAIFQIGETWQIKKVSPKLNCRGEHSLKSISIKNN